VAELDLRAIAFPTLDKGQIAALERCAGASLKRYRDGQKLFQGGNSAGQAVVYLAGLAREVLLLIRDDNLYKIVSSYLARRIEQTDNIEVLKNTEVRFATSPPITGCGGVVLGRASPKPFFRGPRKGECACVARNAIH
jgi:hypothetical protein